MKICFLGAFSGGGTETACFNLANCLSNRYEVHILSSGRNNPSFELNSDIKFTFVKGASIFQKNINLWRYLRQNRIDYLITLEAMTGLVSIVPGILSHTKHIIWEHANYYQNQGSKYIQTVRQIELKTANAYIVLTKRDLENFKKNFVIKTRLDYIYNIVDERVNPSYDLSSKCIISVGHIRKIKNFIVIPEIAKIVFGKHPDWRWKIYGTACGQEYERILKKIKEYGLENKVVFVGRYDEMNNVYQNASMCVMTSLKEGLPMVLLEAKSNGLPLVSFDVETGPDEIIRDNINGFLIPPYEIETMARKICVLIENENMRKEFSEKSIIDLDCFCAEKIAKKWIDLFEEISKE